MEKVLKKDNLRDWVIALSSYEVHAPAFEDEVWNFKQVEKPEDAALDHTNTVKPPKDFSFPQREVYCEFAQKKGEAPMVTETLPALAAPKVVFGVRPCDGRAGPRNDTVFSKEFDDIYYWMRRKKVAQVGLACNTPPSRNCFCTAVGGSPHSEDGLDVLMVDLGDSYLVKALTKVGEEIVKAGGKALGNASAADKKTAAKAKADAEKAPMREIVDIKTVPENLQKNFDSEVWGEMAQACIGCGICTFLCPTCHCFDINDEVTNVTPLRGQRVRTWDNCQFPDFTMHSSGHNPRNTLGARLRQRVCHKFLYFVQNHDTYQCVGCGRCISECPVGIDIVAVVNKVAHDVG